MFFNDYSLDNESLCKLWGEFSKVKQSYTPNERWNELVNTDAKNAEFATLTMDNIIYDFYEKTYDEESEKTQAPFYCTTMMIIIAKKAAIDYRVEMNLPSYEFTTYFEGTRLTTVFERNKEFSEALEVFTKYQEKMLEVFNVDEITLWRMFNEPELIEKFDELAEDNENFGIPFLETFTNILTHDFVRHYLHLPNERIIPDYFEKEDEDCEGQGSCVGYETPCCGDKCYNDSEV